MIGSSFEPSSARNPSAFARAADTARVDARLWHPWLRINRVLRVMLHTRLSAEAWSVIRVEFRRALALRSVASPAAKLSRAAPVSRGSVGHHGIRLRAESGGHDSRQLSKTTHAARSRNSEENIKPT